MEKKFLIVNIGSASKKYALYSEEREVAKIHFEHDENGGSVANYTSDTGSKKLTSTEKEYENAFNLFLETAKDDSVISDFSDISSIGIRIVAPGDQFLKTQVIDDEYLNNLKSAQKIAPLHISNTVEEIEKIKAHLSDITLIGVSDSAFHSTMPKVSKQYALPANVPSHIRRYGYHGISLQSVSNSVRELLGEIPTNTIVCHLGGGVSLTALKNGKSVDTSMGFSPLEGLPMSTRVGNIGVSAVIQIEKEMGLPHDQLDIFFNNQCGLLGLSGKTSDIRELISLEESGDEKSKNALEYFVYSIKKYVGAYSAVLGGLDLLVFTATIGERSYDIRSRVCEGLEYLGVNLDIDKNNIESGDEFVEKDSSKVRIAVINTDEMKEIASEIQRIN